MTQEQPDNPLHGVTLKALLEDLVARHGWAVLAARVPIACFADEPSVKSSLRFLRRTPWARAKVERMWVDEQRVIARNRKRNKRRAAMRAHRAASEAADGDSPATDSGTGSPPDPDVG